MLALLCLCLGAIALAADQAFKFHIVSTLPLGEVRPLLPGLIQLETVHNYGAAWSSFSGQRWFLIGLTAAIMILVALLLMKRVLQHPLGYIALTLILSGGIGNLIDRIRLGYVVDMFSLQLFSFPVFNIADICITAGCGLGLLYYFLLHEEKEAREAANETAAAEPEPAEVSEFLPPAGEGGFAAQSRMRENAADAQDAESLTSPLPEDAADASASAPATREEQSDGTADP